MQLPVGSALPLTSRVAYAEALKRAELELREAQAAVSGDDSNENRERYARAVFEHDQLSGMFPFVAAGLGDEEA